MKVYRQKNARKILYLFLCIFAIQLFIPNLGDVPTFVVLSGFFHEPILIIELVGFSVSFTLGLIVFLRLKKMTKTRIRITSAICRASILLIIFWVFHDFAYLITASPMTLPTRGLFTLIPLFFLRKELKNIEFNLSPTVKSGAVATVEQKELTINPIQTRATPSWSIPLIDSTIIFLFLMFIPTLTIDTVDYFYSSPYNIESLFDMFLSRLSYFWFSYDRILLSVCLLSFTLLLGIWSSLEIHKDLKGGGKLIKRSAPIYLFWILYSLLVSPAPTCYYTICEFNIPLQLLITLPFGIHLFYYAHKYPAVESPRSTEIGSKFPDMDDENIQILRSVGIISLQDLAKEDAGELSKILELPLEPVKKWIHTANEAVPAPPSLNLLHAIDGESIKIMQKVGIKSLRDLAKEDPGELGKILELPREKVDKWIQDARETLIKMSDEEKGDS